MLEYVKIRLREETAWSSCTSRLNARMQGYPSINTKNPPTVDFENLHVNAYIDVRHLEATRLNTFEFPPFLSSRGEGKKTPICNNRKSSPA